MKIEVKDWNLVSTGTEIELPDEMFNAPVRVDIVAQVVRWQLAKARSGNASTKTRSDVSGTTRKPWAQKESGKARQGSLRGPHFRGGGVVFGPHPRSYAFKLNKKIRDNGIFSILSDRMREGRIQIVNSFVESFDKTKEFVEWKDKHSLGKVLFIGDVYAKLVRCINNVPFCDILSPEGLNVLSCVKHDDIIFDLESITDIMSRYGFFYDLDDELVNEEDSIEVLDSNGETVIEEDVK